MANQRRAMNEDIAWLELRRDEFVAASCPACRSDDAQFLYVKYGINQVRCRACATQFANPRPKAETLERFYAESANYDYWAKHIFPKSANVRRLEIFGPRADFITKLAKTRNLGIGALLEVGAAYGWFCVAVKELGGFSRVIGIEPTPRLAQVCRGQGLEIIESSYEHAKPDCPISVVAAFEVVEHLYDPEGFLRWCLQLLTPGGCVYITCPNIRGFETLVLGKESPAVDHEHLNMFNPDSLKLLAARTGFTDIEITTPGKLDVDLVREAREEGRIGDQALGTFVTHLLDRSEETGESFQAWLRTANLSSHMMMTAFRPAS